jgi:hypothetical protein
MAEHGKPGVLWWFTGVMLLFLAAAGGGALSGAATALGALAGAGEALLAWVAVGTLLAGFALALAVGLGDLARLARRGATALPLRWVPGSFLALLVAAPFWNLCVVHVQERLTGSDSVRVGFDNVEYGLVLTVIPLAVGVPLLLARLRRRSHPDPAAAQV